MTRWPASLEGVRPGDQKNSQSAHYAFQRKFSCKFSTSPNFVAPFLSESGHPDRVNSRPPGEEEDEDINDDEEKDRDIPWESTPPTQPQNDALGSLLLPAELEKEVGRDSEEMQRSGSLQLIAVDQLIAPTQNEVSSIATAIPTPYRSETPAAKTKIKRKKPAKPTVDVLSSSEDERSAKKTKDSRTRTVADAMIEVERIRDAAKERDLEVQKIRFEAEQKQRDQQHAILLQQGQERLNLHQETLLRLQLQLSKGQVDRS